MKSVNLKDIIDYRISLGEVDVKVIVKRSK